MRVQENGLQSGYLSAGMEHGQLNAWLCKGLCPETRLASQRKETSQKYHSIVEACQGGNNNDPILLADPAVACCHSTDRVSWDGSGGGCGGAKTSRRS